MDHFTLSLAVGAVAGALDVIPMIFQNLSARSCFSAFFIYFFAAVIVFYSDLPYLPWWADGMAVTLMLMIPVLFTFSGKDRNAIWGKRCKKRTLVRFLHISHAVSGGCLRLYR